MQGAARRPGERVDVYDEGGWWEGELVAGPGSGSGAAAGGSVTVRLVDGEREVPLAHVRSTLAWAWQAGGGRWRLLSASSFKSRRSDGAGNMYKSSHSLFVVGLAERFAQTALRLGRFWSIRRSCRRGDALMQRAHTASRCSESQGAAAWLRFAVVSACIHAKKCRRWST